jgi:autotransporter-associated beta strand protein
VHEVLQSGQNLSLISGGNIEVGKAATLSAAQSVELAGSSVDIQGVIRANDGLKGGAITVVGNAINLGSTAVVDATGATAGGLIQIGGSWQNSNPAVRQAITTTIAQGALLDASALQRGDGGTVVAWSDIRNPQSVTTVSGTLLAKGGAAGGNGGRIETSGYDLKVDDIRVDTTAAAGAAGLWLLDPYNISIESGNTTTYTSSGGTYTGNGNISTAYIAASTIASALASSNVTVTTGGSGSAGTGSGDITVTGLINSGGSNKLTLNAYRNISISKEINTGSLELIAGGTITASGDQQITLNSSSGVLTIDVAQDSVFTGYVFRSNQIVKKGAGTFTFNHSSGLANNVTNSIAIDQGTLQFGNGGLTGLLPLTNAPITIASGASLSINHSDNVTVSMPISGAGSVIQSGTGKTTLSGTLSYTGGTLINKGTLALTSTNNTTTGSTTVATSANLELSKSTNGTGSIILNGGGLTLNTLSDITVSNDITGTGSVTKTNNSAATLTGNNTYSGTTTISYGNLQVGNGGTSGSLGTSNIIINNPISSLNFNRSDALVVAGSITGSGSIHQQGTGTTTLNNPGYSGTTYLDNGGLQLDVTSGSLPTSKFFVGSGGSNAVSLTINNPSGTLTLNQDFQGNGTSPSDSITVMGGGTTTFSKSLPFDSFNQTGVGTTILTNSNSFATTTVGVGSTLQIGNGTSSGSLSGPITNDGTLIYTRNDNITVSNTITGTGSTTIGTTGSVTLSGNVTNSSVSINALGTSGLTGTGKITAQQLAINAGGPVTPSATHDVQTLAIAGSQVSFANTGALTIGSVNSIAGINATGLVAITTNTGNITLNAPVVTTSTASGTVTSTGINSPALMLNAGVSTGAGAAGGGDIIVGPGGTVSVGSGGRGLLYSGKYADGGSSYLDALVGSTTSLVNLRFNSDELAKNYTAAIGTGLTAIYRQDVVFVVAPLTSTVYGNLPVISENTLTYRNGNYQPVSGAALGTITGTATWQFNGATSTSNNAVVGTSPLVYVSGLTNDLGKVLVNDPNNRFTITPKALTISGITAADKVYDGNTTATVSTAGVTASGIVAGDVVTVNATGLFADKNVASGQTVNITSSTGGADAANYSITGQSTTTASITPRTVSLSASKTYNGNTDLTGAVTITTGVGAETLSYSGATASDSHVATVGKSITAITLADGSGGGLAANYVLPTLNATNAPVTITAAPITAAVTNTNVSKTYDGSTSATDFVPSWQLSGLLNGDTATLSYSAAYNNANVLGASQLNLTNLALASISATSGAFSSDYQLSTSSLNLNASITPKALSISGTTAAGRAYDGTTTATITPGTLSGFVGNETVALASATGVFDSKDAGARTATATYVLANGTNGGLASNYSLAPSTGLAATITAKTVSLSASKVYNGSTDLTGAVSIATGVSGETLTYSGATASDSHVATTGKFISAISLANGSGGGLATNYVLPALDATNAAVTITAAPITASLNNTSASKIYDGTTSASGFTPSWQLSGFAAGDSATISYSAAYNNANVVGANQLNLTSLALATITGGSGTLSDYQLNTSNLSLSASITPATISAIGGLFTTRQIRPHSIHQEQRSQAGSQMISSRSTAMPPNLQARMCRAAQAAAFNRKRLQPAVSP